MTESITDSTTLEFLNSGVSHVKMVATNSVLTCSSDSGDIDLLGIKDLDASGVIDTTDINVDGRIKLSDIAAPSNPLDGEGLLYKKTGNDGVFWKPDSAGIEVDLTSTSGVSVYTRTAITNLDSPYTILSSDEIIGVDTSSGTVSATLPQISTIGGGNNYKKYYIVDEGGNSTSNNITVNTSGSDTINKQTSPMIITVDHTSITLYSDGSSNWVVL